MIRNTKIMKKKINSSSPHKTIYFIIFTLVTSSFQNPKCVVDQCKRCRYINIDTCDECESGYYLRTWYGKDKKRDYNACWNLMYLLFSLLGTLLLTLSYLYCCYRAYKKGKSIIKIVSDKKDKKVIKDERKISKGSKYKDERDIPSTSRPINIETEPNDQTQINVPNIQGPGHNQINIPTQNTLPAQVNLPPQNIQTPVVVANTLPQKPHNIVRNVYSPARSFADQPSHNKYYGNPPATTIIRERPTTIIREIDDNHDDFDEYERVRKVPRKKVKRKPSARVIRYEPDSIKNVNQQIRRGVSNRRMY